MRDGDRAAGVRDAVEPFVGREGNVAPPSAQLRPVHRHREIVNGAAGLRVEDRDFDGGVALLRPLGGEAGRHQVVSWVIGWKTPVLAAVLPEIAGVVTLARADRRAVGGGGDVPDRIVRVMVHGRGRVEDQRFEAGGRLARTPASEHVPGGRGPQVRHAGAAAAVAESELTGRGDRNGPWTIGSHRGERLERVGSEGIEVQQREVGPLHRPGPLGPVYQERAGGRVAQAQRLDHALEGRPHGPLLFERGERPPLELALKREGHDELVETGGDSRVDGQLQLLDHLALVQIDDGHFAALRGVENEIAPATSHLQIVKRGAQGDFQRLPLDLDRLQPRRAQARPTGPRQDPVDRGSPRLRFRWFRPRVRGLRPRCLGRGVFGLGLGAGTLGFGLGPPARLWSVGSAYTTAGSV